LISFALSQLFDNDCKRCVAFIGLRVRVKTAYPHEARNSHNFSRARVTLWNLWQTRGRVQQTNRLSPAFSLHLQGSRCTMVAAPSSAYRSGIRFCSTVGLIALMLWPFAQTKTVHHWSVSLMNSVGIDDRQPWALFSPQRLFFKKRGISMPPVAWECHDPVAELNYDTAGALTDRYFYHAERAVRGSPRRRRRRGLAAARAVRRAGTVVARSNAATGMVASNDNYAYSVFGEPSSTQGSMWRFTGRQLDAETGLYYYRARMYNPALGRFMQTDPMGDVDSLNLYQYAMWDPIVNKDPFGLCAQGGPDEVVVCGTRDDPFKFDRYFSQIRDEFRNRLSKPQFKFVAVQQGQNPTSVSENSCSSEQFSVGIGGTAAVFFGLNGQVAAGVSLPSDRQNFRDYQLFAQMQLGYLAGSGGFAGFGLSGNYSSSSAPLPVADASTFSQFEGDIGFGPSIGVNVQGTGVPGRDFSPTGGGVGLPGGGRLSYGAGVFLGLGGGGSVTLATPASGPCSGK
jgi:RHS repeat-associated protein